MATNPQPAQLTRRGLYLPWAMVFGAAGALVVLFALPVLAGYSAAVQPLEKLDQQVRTTQELQSEVKDMRQDLAANAGALRERVARLESR